ncbi:MAG: NUMOD3 domain-containing DNA-binding protein [Candidatus Subteraquimicrobiales bacterium]|nr:NUMOD3 domain-containing DNA-binding protein [Candidatus Subteraquimicrobiales bacterium]
MPKKGYKPTEEVRKKLSESHKGKALSEEQKKKISNALKGRIPHNKGKHIINAGTFKKGQRPWNKGGGAYSVETRKKMSASRMGKKLSKETRKKMSDNRKGHPTSEETKVKISKSTKGRIGHFTGKKHNKQTKEKLSKIGVERQKTLWNDQNYRDHMSSVHSGEKSHNWKGGISFLPYCPKFNTQLKERIRDRDNRTCQLCGTQENDKKLDVHHIHYDKQNCNPDLIALCHDCNAKSNGNREYYERFFMNKLNARGLLCWYKE